MTTTAAERATTGPRDRGRAWLRPALAATVLLALALALRLAGLSAGLPHVHQVDEPSYAGAAVALDWGRLRPEEQLSPTGFRYAILALRTLVGLSSSLEGRLRDLAGAGDTEAWHFLLGRSVSALSGALSVVPVFLLGLWLAGPWAAAVAGALLAVDYLHVRQSHWGTPDVLMLACVLLSLAASVRYGLDGRRRWVLLVGACAGLAAVTKLPGVLALLAFGLAAIRAPARWPVRLLDGALAGLVAAATFLAVDPWVVLDPEPFLRDTRYILRHADHIAEGQPRGAVVGVYLDALWRSAGPVLLACGALGAVLVVRQRDRRGLRIGLLLLLPAAYLAWMASKQSVYVRYALVLVPFVALLAGVAAEWLVARATAGARAWLGAVLVVVLAAWPAAQAVRFDVLLAREDTREQANAWLAAQRARDEHVLLDSFMSWLPPDTPSPRTRSLGMFIRLDQVLAACQAAGLDARWLVTEDWVPSFWDRSLVRVPGAPGSRVSEQAAAFYRSLPQRGALVAEFRPAPGPVPFHYEQMYGPWDHLWVLERPGPAVRIWDLSRAPAGR